MRCPIRTATLAAAFLFLFVPAATAQPPEPPPGPRDGPPPHGPHDPLRRALDTNHDFELDADEIAGAPEALATLDADGDGRLDHEELRPPLGPPPGGPGRGPGDRGFEGRPRRPGEPGGRPPRADRDRPPPPREGDEREGPPSPPDRDGPDGRPPREAFRSGERGPGERPSPERFTERALSFDADGDGKLDGAELAKFAEAIAERMRAGRPGGPPRDGGERPERPRRPE